VNKRVSVVIPNLHSPLIGETLNSLRKQKLNLAQVEVIVVGMDKYGIVHSDDLIKFVETPQPLCAAAARNLGVARATGEIIVFLDADCVVADDWLREILANFADPSVHVLVGGVEFPTDEYWTLCDNIATFYDFHTSAPSGTRYFAPTLNFALRREVLEVVGGFDESFPGAAGEDVDLSFRIRLAGYEIHFRPNVIISHHPVRNSFSKVLKRSFVFGKNMLKVYWRYRDSFKLTLFHSDPWLLLLFAPILALAVTIKVFLRAPFLLRYWYTAPMIWLAKIAWRLGGARYVFSINAGS
jgi:cellulose synthase/poly-beta-1,6-N-acetylglucosamine synthase-like glycosyltransferase